MYHARQTGLEPPRRVIIIGSPGSEKAELARVIAERLRLPCIELERLYWRPGWEKPDAQTWQTQVSELAAREAWVMSGTFPSTLDIRVARADWLVWVDLPMPVCFVHKLRDMMRRNGEKRPEVAPGCPQRFDMSLLRFIWTFPSVVLPRIAALVARERRNRTIFILRSKRERDDFLAKVPIVGDGPGQTPDA